MLHTTHLIPGITRDRIEVHVLNSQLFDFVEPGEAPIKPQHIRVADIPIQNRKTKAISLSLQD